MSENKIIIWMDRYVICDNCGTHIRLMREEMWAIMMIHKGDPIINTDQAPKDVIGCPVCKSTKNLIYGGIKEGSEILYVKIIQVEISLITGPSDGVYSVMKRSKKGAFDFILKDSNYGEAMEHFLDEISNNNLAGMLDIIEKRKRSKQRGLKNETKMD